MGRQSRFHLAVLGVGSALGGFLFAFSRFTLSSALAVAPLTRIQSGPTAGTAPSIYAQQGKCRNHAAFSTLKTIKQPL